MSPERNSIRDGCRVIESENRECVYVIGAGFSAALGYPLTSDFLFRLWSRLSEDLRASLEKVVRFHHPNFSSANFASFPNIETLMSEMLVNAQLFRASRQYEGRFKATDLSDLQGAVLLEISNWFHEISKSRTSPPHWLNQFRDRVYKEKAAIISFNWDLELDKLLFKEVRASNYGLNVQTGAHANPILLKPHGSLNWFEDNNIKSLKPEKLVKLHSSKDRNIVYVFARHRAPISEKGHTYTPLIVPPVYLKGFKEPIFTALWQRCTSVLSTARTIVFMGYSMPLADIHAQFIVRCGFHNQQEGELTTDGKRRPATGSAKVIIVNPDRTAAERIKAIAGPCPSCEWVSSPVAQWVQGETK